MAKPQDGAWMAHYFVLPAENLAVLMRLVRFCSAQGMVRFVALLNRAAAAA